VYAVGDMVKISTKALPLHLDDTQKPKLMPKYIGPLTVVSVSDKLVQVKLPEEYKQVHDQGMASKVFQYMPASLFAKFSIYF
jgi:hypothetical protein